MPFIFLGFGLLLAGQVNPGWSKFFYGLAVLSVIITAVKSFKDV